MTAPYRLAQLRAEHDRTQFKCSSEPLNRYLREQVTQDIKRRVAACFVAIADGGGDRARPSDASVVEQHIAGYYTLASTSILLDSLPPAISKKLPRYPSVPAVRLGRLAVDMTHTGRGLGGALLADALLRAASSEIAAYALVVDAKDELAASFYKHHGFLTLGESDKSGGLIVQLTLFLPLSTVKQSTVKR
jgi:predicted GNAT family N-acyltransferase